MANENQEPIELRGHHIEALAERYARNKGINWEYNREYRSKEEDIAYGNGLENIDDNYSDGLGKKLPKEEVVTSNPLRNSLENLFGIEEKEGVVYPLIDEWLSNYDLEVRVVFGPDSLCRACPMFSENRSREDIRKCDGGGQDNSDREQDSKALTGYGIEEGGVYTMRELIKLFDDYMERTGSPSPRQNEEPEGSTYINPGR